MKEPERVAIIGGAGNMGKLTEDLFRSLGHETIVSDPKLPMSPTAKNAIQQAGIVFFSVLPIEQIGEIIESDIDSFTSDQVVMDNASSKTPLTKAFNMLDELGVSICSTHPMCKHDQPLHGQKALILEFGRNPEKARVIAENLYRNVGMVTIPFAFEEHDNSMVLLQLVPHLVMRSVADVLAKNNTDMDALRKIAPANFDLFNLSLWRTIGQDPNISATVIANLLQQQAGGQRFVEDFQKAIADIVKSTKKENLAQNFDQVVSKLNQNGLKEDMNNRTTTVLERLANLRVKSIIIDATEDRPGLLRSILLPFEQQGISLTAIDSHKTNSGLKFEIGIDEQTDSLDNLSALTHQLEQIGCKVTYKEAPIE